MLLVIVFKTDEKTKIIFWFNILIFPFLPFIIKSLNSQNI